MLIETPSPVASGEAKSSDTPARAPLNGAGRFLVRAGVWLAAAWALPALTHLLGLDWLMLPLLWLGTAGLLRVGATLLDRLMWAMGAMCGGIMLMGYLTTVWPWGLAPVPVAGTAGTVLAVVALVSGRRLSLPSRMLGTDAIIGAGGLLGWYLMAKPSLGTAGLSWTAFATINPDRLRQFNLFDAVLQLGGYPILTPDAAQSIVEPVMLPTYPAGMHYVFGVIDTFVTGGEIGPPLQELDRYYTYVLISFGVLVATVAWAARWVAGPQAAGWKRALMTSALAVFTATGFYSVMIWQGFDAQIVGMIFTAMVVALLARPPRAPAEQVFLVGLLAVATTYTYTLFAVFAALGIVASAVFHWGRLRRHAALVIPVTAIFGVLLSLWYLIPASLGTETGKKLNAGGWILPMPRGLLLAATGLVAVAVFTPSIRRSPRLRILAAVFFGGWVFMAGMWIVNMNLVGFGSYYFQKVVYTLAMIGFITAGAALVHLRPRRWSALRTRSGTFAASAAAVVVAVLLSGAVPWNTIKYNGDHNPGIDTTWSRVWAGRKIYAATSGTLSYLVDRGMVGDGVPTLVLFSPNGGANAQMSITMSVLNHDLGKTWWQAYQAEMNGLIGAGDGELSAVDEAAFQEFLESLKLTTWPLRILVNDEGAAKKLEKFAAANPGLSLDVRFLADMPGETSPYTLEQLTGE